MISKTRKVHTKWASGALVVTSVTAVMVGSLSGVASAAPATTPATAITTAQSTYHTNTGTAVSITGTVTPGTTDANIQMTVTSGPDTPATPNAQVGANCTHTSPSTAYTCSFTPTHGAGTDVVKVYADNDGSNSFTSGDVSSDVTVTVSNGTPFAVSLAPSSQSTQTEAAGTCTNTAAYTATVTDSNGFPVTGFSVNVNVTENPSSAHLAECTPTGPPGGATGTGTLAFNAPTNGNGVASFSFDSDTAGTASVTATAGGASGVASQTFVSNIQNAAKTLTVVPKTFSGYNGSSVTYTATVKDGSGNALGGVVVSWQVANGGPDAFAPTTCGTTNSSGVATCTLNNANAAGTDNVTFWVNQTPGSAGPDSGEPQDTATATFTGPAPTPGAGSGVTCPDQTNGGAPAASCTLPTTQKSITYTATLISGGNPVANATINWTVTVGGGANSANVTPLSGQSTTDANGKATFTVTDSAPAAGNTITATAKVGPNTVGSATATYAAPAVSSLTLTPDPQTVTKGGTVSETVTVLDQFGVGVSGDSVSWSVAGRNSGKSGTVTTGANGTATISYTDTGVNPVANTDTITASDTHGKSDTATINFITGSTTATTVAVATNGVSAGVCPTTTSGSNTKTGVAGGSGDDVCAHVTNSDGTPLQGKTVTFTVDKGFVAAFGTSNASTISGGKTSVTATTDVNGNAFAHVASNTSGTQTVTATADAASGTGTVSYTAGAVRNVTLTPATATINPGSSQKFTAKVTDQFGNGVPGAEVAFTQSGAGSISGSSSSFALTDASGQASVTVTTLATDSGTGSVVADISGNGGGNQCTNAAGNPAGTATAGNCTATSTYTVKATATASSVTVNAANGRTGKLETASATVKDASGAAVANQVVQFTVSGANNANGSATTNASGVATFSYTPRSGGHDKITAIVNNGSTNPSGSKTIAIKQVMRATFSCASPKAHVVKCKLTTVPARSGLHVTLFRVLPHRNVAIAHGVTNQNGIVRFTVRNQPHGKRGYRAKVAGTATTTSTTTGRSVVFVKG